MISEAGIAGEIQPYESNHIHGSARMPEFAAGLSLRIAEALIFQAARRNFRSPKETALLHIRGH